jgi:transcription initiation factor TFIID subunit 6
MEGDRARARRYVRLPEDCVSLCTENLGIQASREVTSVLVEDVSFRIRQVTKVALEFMNHANRKKICKEDFDSALKWSGIEPVYGHNVEPPPFMYIHENGLYSVEDQEMLLRDLSLSPPVAPDNLPPPPSLTACWLLVEGVPVEMDGMSDYSCPRVGHDSYG